MKKFKCLLTAMLLGCSTMSFAQFMNGGGSSASSSDVEAWKGMRFSYDRTFVNFDVPNGVEAPDMDMNGFSIGYEHAFKVAKKLPLFIQTGLDLNFARYSDEESDYDDYNDETETYETKRTTLGLSIPVNFVYGVKINDMLAIKPYTGFYLRVNLMAKDKDTYTWSDGIDSETEEEEYNWFDEKEVGKDGTWNRCQFGWQIGATLDISKFNVGIGYALDFNEIAEKTKNSKFMVKLGYNF